jgi:3,4-dihydroxy 2-butanone 4-phosphate synthase/GTP cyclohydrolase II
MLKNNFSSIESIIKTAKQGKMFILVDDEKRENEGDLVISSSYANTANINFMAKHGRGLICLAMENSQARKLNLSLMSPINQSRNKTAFAISIEAKKGITTGISAKDRARTIKVASKKNASKRDIVSPGHIFPIIAKEGGVLVRAGHTEASVDISKLAKKNNSAVICEIMKDDGTMARGKDLFIFAKKHNLRIAKIEDLISYRLKKEKLVKLKKNLEIKIQDQNFKLKIFENKINGSEHLAFTKGKLGSKIVPKVRVISSNLLLENILIGGKLPDTFNKTMKYFKKFKNCVLVFINENNLSLNNVSFKSNKVVSKSKENKKEYLIKNYGIGAQILKELKIKKMTLLTKTPKNVVGLDGFGIKILNQEIIS